MIVGSVSYVFARLFQEFSISDKSLIFNLKHFDCFTLSFITSLPISLSLSLSLSVCVCVCVSVYFSLSSRKAKTLVLSNYDLFPLDEQRPTSDRFLT